MINTFTNGFGLIVLMYLLAFIFGLVYRAILKNLAKKKMLSGEGRGSKNIGKGDRLLRLVIGVGVGVGLYYRNKLPDGITIFEY
jgi:hypothetical protein